MTRALTLPENQVRALIRAAKKEGARIEVRIGEARATISPENFGTDQEPDFGKVDVKGEIPL